jgi:hypothetical protein
LQNASIESSNLYNTQASNPVSEGSTKMFAPLKNVAIIGVSSVDFFIRKNQRLTRFRAAVI